MAILDTIGILCGSGEKATLLRALPGLLKHLEEPGAIQVFTLPEVRLTEGEADGTLVTAGGLVPGRNRLPAVVYHIAVQRRRENIRKMHAFEELPGVRVLNPSNELSQQAVREMLLSAPRLRPLMPPRVPQAGVAGRPGFVSRPAIGMRTARMICARRLAAGWDFIDGGGVPVGREADAGTAARLAGPGRCLTLALPAQAFSAGRPAGIRGIVQRGPDGEWRVLERLPLFGPAEGFRPPAPDARSESVLEDIARRVGLFLPDMALCTVDLLRVPGRDPLFLGLGGWQPGLLGRHTAVSVKKNLCRNMLGYSRLILHN